LFFSAENQPVEPFFFLSYQRNSSNNFRIDWISIPLQRKNGLNRGVASISRIEEA